MWPFSRRQKTIFTFQPRWKEILVVTGPGKRTFELDFPMGVATAVLPSEECWRETAPLWAREHYHVLHDELEAWCRANDVIFEIQPGAWVGGEDLGAISRS